MTKANSAHQKFYVDTDVGQVHGRRCGAGEPVLLLHWTPLSSRMFRHLMPQLAGAGYQAVALDLPGYGRSDPRPERFSVEQYAQVIAQAMANMSIGSAAAVLGGHNGASVALELALQFPQKVGRLIVDGVPFLTPQLREILLAMAGTPRPSVSEGDSLASLPFERAVGLLKEYIPGFDVNDQTIEMVWEAMIDYLEIDFVSSGDVAGHYEPVDRLPLVSQPTLVLGAEKDSMSASFERACELLPDCHRHFFSGNHPLYFESENHRYGQEILRFLGDPL